MAKKYEVRFAFQSPGLGTWISADTADQVGKLPEKELAHALKQGYVIERSEAGGLPEEESAETYAEATGQEQPGRGGRTGKGR